MSITGRQARISIATIIVLCLLAFIVYAFNNQPRTYSATEDYSVSSSLTAVQAYGTNEIVYSNGNALMLYNYSTGQATQLSPSVGLSASGIDSISVSQNDQLILFHNEQTDNGGILSKQLQNQGLSPQSDYWWLYDTATKSFQVLPQTTLLAKLSGNNLEALALVGGSEELIDYNTSNLSTLSTIDISGVDNFFAVNNGFVLQTPGNDVLFTQNGTISQLLASNATMVAITPNDQQAIITSTRNGTEQIDLLNLQSHSQKTIATNITGRPVLSSSGSGDVLYDGSGGNLTTTLYVYDLSTGRATAWDFESSNSLSQTTLSPVAMLSPQEAVVSASVGVYYLVGINLVKPQVSL